MRVWVTGRVGVRAGSAQLDQSALPGRLGKLLLVRLAVDRHPIERDRLVEDLWGEDPPRAIDSVLNATFSRLRSAFNSIGLDGRAILVSGNGIAELRRPPETRIDLETAHRSVDAAEGHLRAGRTEAAWADAVVAHAVAAWERLLREELGLGPDGRLRRLLDD